MKPKAAPKMKPVKEPEEIGVSKNLSGPRSHHANSEIKSTKDKTTHAPRSFRLSCTPVIFLKIQVFVVKKLTTRKNKKTSVPGTSNSILSS